jgi:hypothetical protein
MHGTAMKINIYMFFVIRYIISNMFLPPSEKCKFIETKIGN